MELTTSTVQRNLDAKMKVLGFDAPELLSVLIFAAVMNLFFAKTALAPILVFFLPSVLLLFFYFGKKGRAEDYLIHLVRYYLNSGSFEAGKLSGLESKRKEKIYE